ncbi:hypothetical protein Mal64_38460 [Pseudobythopirellula maris]|uniref:Autotransporter-associated beta strand repeat protein n=1 Tax=Pseudobythopirellula maris TaxID=2527991 RepID=A0A5C5ZGF9_9BACT|nr:dockerin type I domain-containing protein [Pseudobythopirellula maris]TWT86306.1 hypothetical protein Mal64_38460 [Pseudobythopirellula maris]
MPRTSSHALLLLKTCAVLAGVLVAATAGRLDAQQLHSWNALSEGAYANPANWLPANTPDSVNETARFDLFGSHTVGYEFNADILVHHLQVANGDFHFKGNQTSSLRAAHNFDLESGSLELEDFVLSVDETATLGSETLLELGNNSYYNAGATNIAAGTDNSSTELLAIAGATPVLGDLSLAETGGGNFEGLVTVMPGVEATVDNVSIATTGGEGQHGVLQVIGGVLQQNGPHPLVIGSDSELDTSGMIAAINSSDLRFSSHVTVNPTGRLRVSSSRVFLPRGLTVNGGEYRETGAVLRGLTPQSRLEALEGGELKLGDTLLTLGQGHSVGLDNASLTSVGGVAISDGGGVDLAGDAQFASTLSIGAGGTLTVEADATATLSGALTNHGGAAHVAAGASLIIDGDYAGDGFTGSGAVEFRGLMSPGQGPAEILLEGDAVWSSAAVLEIEVLGPPTGAGHDRIVLNGDAQLGGELRVALLEGAGGVYSPLPGRRLELIRAGGALSGAFDEYSLPALTSGLDWRVLQTTGALSLVVDTGLTGDFNADGAVDAADFTVWRDTLNQTGPAGLLAADGNLDGVVDGGDWVVWRDHYGDTLTSPAAGVPEPAGAAIALLAGCLGAAARRPRRLRRPCGPRR